MVDQDMQAAFGVTSYQGRWALILDSVGELGPTLSLEGKTVWRNWAPDSLALQYLWRRWAHNILSLSFVCLLLLLGEIGPDIGQCGGAVPRKQ